ncbi:uncharacterized protein N7459_003692 [Penicillium hispanicum]|uniref:uncharacterized protein n=1 Tax=Penicillium hispanicum TaxID=1080232 RepID=UPI00253F738D|nr:uncharacterized protein N7459_003692 [Penicillium hispanicum]KAJ5587927.1 hypothetical protein N7459_003692 [Penicillium hispanicum]
MARVVRRAASASVRRAPSRAVQRRARKHKVIMESVTQEKKKLRSVISFEVKAPSGYTFIPAGNPLLTTTCKERCRKEGLQIYAVSTTPHTRTHNLSQHVHRIGYHFPSTEVAAACSELGLYLTSAGKAVPFHTLGTAKHHTPADSEVSQEVINMEARDAIKDLFPNIPDKDLFQIIKTAFQKGQGKVGTAPELPLARRAQLAVVAHIRHIYTDYDRLLKSGSFHEARSAVEQSTLAKLIAWRGDDENGQTVLEDVFREVIVISDDEDSETDEGVAATSTRDPSVEVLSRNARTHEIQTLAVPSLRSCHQDSPQELSEEAPPPGFRFVAKMPAKKAIDRRGFSRYQAWNRALNRYRAEAHGTEQDAHGDGPAEQQSPRYVKRPVATHEHSDPRRLDITPLPTEAITRFAPGRVHVGSPAQRMLGVPAANRLVEKHVGAQEAQSPLDNQRIPSQHGSIVRPSVLTTQQPHEVRSLEKSPRSNGQVFYFQNMPHLDMESTRAERFPVSSINRANVPIFVSGPKELHDSSESQLRTRNETTIPHPRSGVNPSNPQDVVLPSIETPWTPEKRQSEGRLENLTKRMSLRSLTPGHSSGDISHNTNVAALDGPDQGFKRRRLAYYGPRHDNSSLDNRNRPIGISACEKIDPKGQYRRNEIVPEHRPQGSFHYRHDQPTLMEQPVLTGHQRERPSSSLVLPQVNPDARAFLDRTRVVDLHEQAPFQYPQSGPSGINGVTMAGDRARRSALDVLRPETQPAYDDDRSPRMDRVRPTMVKEIRAPLWQPRIDGNRPVVHDAPFDGQLYADGFVRHVDIREPRPAEYFTRRSRNQPMRGGEIYIQPSRARIPDRYAAQDPPQRLKASGKGQVPSLHMADTSHNQISDVASGKHEQLQLSTATSRERRPGSGFSTTRRVHDPRSFPMAEQNRPIYVQRVESRPPQYTAPDERHIVIVE